MYRPSHLDIQTMSIVLYLSAYATVNKNNFTRQHESCRNRSLANIININQDKENNNKINRAKLTDERYTIKPIL